MLWFLPDREGTRQEKDANGQKEGSPNPKAFQMKLSSLESRGKQISDAPLKTLYLTIDTLRFA